MSMTLALDYGKKNVPNASVPKSRMWTHKSGSVRGAAREGGPYSTPGREPWEEGRPAPSPEGAIERAEPGRFSGPQVSRVVGDSVLLEQTDELFLEGPFLVVLFLSIDVARDGGDVRLAHAECGVLLLPRETRYSLFRPGR